MMGFVRREECPVCGCPAATTLFSCPFDESPVADYLRGYYRLDAPGPLAGHVYQLDECDGCGLVFQRYVGNDALLAELYGVWLSGEGNRKGFEDRWRRVLPRSSRDGHELFWIAAELGKPVRALRTLDYGMGWGKWARIALALGCESHGFDLSDRRMEEAAAAGVRAVREFPDDHFDFINTEQVMEHVTDPGGVAASLAAALKPGGILKVSVPNGEAVRRDLPGGDWRGTLNPVAPLEHVNCFGRRSIRALGQSAGLVPYRPSILKQYAFLAQEGALDNWREALKSLARPWHRFHNSHSLYMWLQKPVAPTG